MSCLLLFGFEFTIEATQIKVVKWNICRSYVLIFKKNLTIALGLELGTQVNSVSTGMDSSCGRVVWDFERAHCHF